MPLIKRIIFILFLCFCRETFSQSGTIRIQRNPGRIDAIFCGGVWGRSGVIVELRTLQPSANAAQALFVPGRYSVNSFSMQNGLGAHVHVPFYHLYFNRNLSVNFNFVPGYDYFAGRHGDSLYAADGMFHSFRYGYSLIPAELWMSAELMSRRHFHLSLLGKGGAGLLFTHYNSPAGNNISGSITGNYGFGIAFHFQFRTDYPIALTINAVNISNRWFRELSLLIPVYPGRYRRI